MVALSAYYPMTGVTEQLAQWQKFSAYYFGDGVIQSTLNTFTVVQSTPAAMSVGVQSGQAIIQGVFGENGTLTTLTIAAADATNPRIDRVVLRVDTSANDMEVLVLTGTPAVSPSAPAVVRSATQTDYSLAQVLVGTTVTSIVTGNITDERTWASPRGIPHASRIITAAGTIQPFGANPTSGGTLPAALTANHLMQQVTGTTTITNIATSPAPPAAGGLLVLDFISTGATVQSGGNLVIPRNYVAGTQDAMLMLIYDGNNWLEWGRSGEQAPAHKYFGNNTGTAACATFVSLVAADLPSYGTITFGSLTQGVGVPYTQSAGRAVLFGKFWQGFGQFTPTGTGTAGTSLVLTMPTGITFNVASGQPVGNWRLDAASSFGGVITVNGSASPSNVNFLVGTNPGGLFGVTPTTAVSTAATIWVSLYGEIQ